MTDHIYAHEHPESDRRREGGFTLWFTGLSGAGKTTIAHLVGPAIEERGPIVEYLDGDTVRTHLSKGLGFSKEDRDANIERIGWVASRLARAGAAVIVSAISPYEEALQKARAFTEEHAPFVLVYVATSLEEDATGIGRSRRAVCSGAAYCVIRPFAAIVNAIVRAGTPRASLYLHLDGDRGLIGATHCSRAVSCRHSKVC